MEGLAGLLPFVLIAVVFWFLLIRPQRKRQLEMLATQRAVTVGDEIMLGAGIVGRVVAADEEFLRLETSPGVAMKVARAAVVRVIRPDEPLSSDAVEPAEPADHIDPTDPPSRDH